MPGPMIYITKPFNVNELLARVRAALRRAATPLEPETAVIELGDFRIDIPARKVEVRKKEVHLTPERVRPFGVSRSASRKSRHSSCSADHSMGTEQRPATGIPSCVCWTLAQET